MFTVGNEEKKQKSQMKQRPDANPFQGFTDDNDTA